MNGSSTSNTYGIRSSLSESSSRSVNTFSSSRQDGFLDMSQFFTTKPEAQITGVTEDDLLTAHMFRTVDGVRIPLQVGTIIVEGHVMLMLYHDHVTADGSRDIQRIYVAVRNADDGSGLV